MLEGSRRLKFLSFETFLCNFEKQNSTDYN